jgi:hypothetical protein
LLLLLLLVVVVVVVVSESWRPPYLVMLSDTGFVQARRI